MVDGHRHPRARTSVCRELDQCRVERQRVVVTHDDAAPETSHLSSSTNGAARDEPESKIRPRMTASVGPAAYGWASRALTEVSTRTPTNPTTLHIRVMRTTFRRQSPQRTEVARRSARAAFAPHENTSTTRSVHSFRDNSRYSMEPSFGRATLGPLSPQERATGRVPRNSRQQTRESRPRGGPKLSSVATREDTDTHESEPKQRQYGWFGDDRLRRGERERATGLI